ncbi:MAG: GTP pyrophosphokinase family protein [Gordonia sp. (in: high G+C Gram-positive bacteria)]|uniref:GTP pyrophosphokinase n=1 Tax=Gordonia sp. (in: high G+C Gram-positive bacteria) TaxID=84139 RepID=UPI003BB73A02
MRDELRRFLMEYQFAVDEMLTKVAILRDEFVYLHRHNPIEHVNSRVKSVDSLLNKAARRQLPVDLPSIREGITDIAGIRITCAFTSDAYRVLDSLTSQRDVQVLTIKDYIANPKPNGYRSLHAVVSVPVFLSTGPVDVTVELQLRTVAMDFWASAEHKIFYKFAGRVPAGLVDELAEAAAIAADLDRRMEELHIEVHGTTGPDDPDLEIDDAVLGYFLNNR